MKSRANSSYCQFGLTLYSWAPRLCPESWWPRFKSASYVPGNFLLGKGASLVSDDGRGLDRIIDQDAKPLALANEKTGRSYWYIGPCRIGMLMTNPADIRAIIDSSNWDNIHLEDSTGSFALVFGEHSAFAMKYGTSEHRETRKRFVNYFLMPDQLRKDTPLIQSAANLELKQVQQQQVIDIGDYASASTMRTIGKLKLGFEKFGDEDKEIKPNETVEYKIADVIHDVSREVASGNAQIKKKYYSAARYKHFFENSRLAKRLKDGEALIRDELIEKNKETILNSPNWLNMDGKTAVDLNSEEVLNKVKELFVAGHDTTKVLLRAVLMLLADPQHQEEVEKLRNDLAKLPGTPETWGYDHIKSVERLDWIVNETLRLYPPVPDMNFGVKRPFKFGDGMFYPGDTIFMSSRIIHRDPKVWGEDAHLFKPERFKGVNLQDKIGAFFPFGFYPRDCPGQNFARLKVKITIARWVSQFDFKFVNNNYHHPFDYNQIFTLRFTDDHVPIEVKPRVPEKVEFLRLGLG